MVTDKQAQIYKSMLSPEDFEKYINLGRSGIPSCIFKYTYEACYFYSRHCQLLWKYGAFGGRLGLNWIEVEVKLRLFKTKEYIPEILELIEEIKISEK